MSTTNFELIDLARQEGIQLFGVFMKNDLRNLRPLTGNYIINLQSDNEGNGTHWCALIIRGYNSFYYDPYGAYPTQEVQTFCKRLPKSCLAFSNQIIQDIESDLCGYFCIACIMYMKNTDTNNIYNYAENYFTLFFKDDTKMNDDILRKFFKSYSRKSSSHLLKKLYRK